MHNNVNTIVDIVFNVGVDSSSQLTGRQSHGVELAVRISAFDKGGCAGSRAQSLHRLYPAALLQIWLHGRQVDVCLQARLLDNFPSLSHPILAYVLAEMSIRCLLSFIVI